MGRVVSRTGNNHSPGRSARQYRRNNSRFANRVVPSTFFALAHPQHVAAGIDVSRLELSRFARAQSTAVQHGQHCAVAQTAAGLKQRIIWIRPPD